MQPERGPHVTDELVAAVRAALPRVLIAVDFDGTLAPIVPDPKDSVPVRGAVEALTALASAGAQVAIITGRDARTVLSLGGLGSIPGVAVAGLYGLETWRDGILHTPDVPPAVEALRARLPGVLTASDADAKVWVEDKRLSLVVHGRLADDPVAALAPLRGPVADLAAELGLELHPGNGVLELRLPDHDKAGVLARLVDDTDPSVVVYAGDDIGDVPAFEEIHRLRDAGRAAWAVGVGTGATAVAEVVAAVDVLLDSPDDVIELLTRLTGSA